jgi:hypothetical protein
MLDSGSRTDLLFSDIAGWVVLLKPYTADLLEAVFIEQLCAEKPYDPARPTGVRTQRSKP